MSSEASRDDEHIEMIKKRAEHAGKVFTSLEIERWEDPSVAMDDLERLRKGELLDKELIIIEEEGE